MFNDKWIFFLSLLSLNLCFLICFLFLNSWKAFFLFWFLMISFSELLKKEFKIFLKFEFLNFWKFLFLNFEPPPLPFMNLNFLTFQKKIWIFFFEFFFFEIWVDFESEYLLVLKIFEFELLLFWNSMHFWKKWKS